VRRRRYEADYFFSDSVSEQASTREVLQYYFLVVVDSVIVGRLFFLVCIVSEIGDQDPMPPL
jgi:hypothetical protein